MPETWMFHAPFCGSIRSMTGKPSSITIAASTHLTAGSSTTRRCIALRNTLGNYRMAVRTGGPRRSHQVSCA
jgi:hypothetical protein